MPELKPNEKTVIEMADAICDAILGPSPFRDVCLMNSVADRLSERGFAIALTEPVTAYGMLQLSAELGEKAQALDNALVEKFAVEFGGAA